MNDLEDYLMLSGIQHFDFCRRQWALIHVEQQWKENELTAEGRFDHSVCHDEKRVEKRNDIIIMRGMKVVSHKLKLSGVCDVVEFRRADEGIKLKRYEGEWLPVPIEYKHGHSKSINADRLQLCAQAIALEEMLLCDVSYGYLFYKETNRRELVEFCRELRETTEKMVNEMSLYYQKGYVPKAKKRSACLKCSLKDLCLPSLNDRGSVSDYIDKFLEGEE